jgi:hypothetical protein
MRQRVERDRVIFKFGDTAWELWGINPRMAPIYMLFLLLTKQQQGVMRFYLRAFVEAKKKTEKERRDCAA